MVGKSKFLLKLVLAVFLLISLSFYYFRDLNSHIFHIDEEHFIRKSYFFDLFFIKHDFKDIRWYEHDAPDQPKLGPYIYGLSLHLTGLNDIDDTFSKLNFRNFLVDGQRWSEKYWSKRLEDFPNELIPILEPIWTGRRVAVIFSLATFLCLFLLATKEKSEKPKI